ncbi:MAG: transcriptional repressor LexA [Gammaproteobacteria bacterium]|nr:transcriptional repressor LexA [Gammaproteobacteria bacterium]
MPTPSQNKVLQFIRQHLLQHGHAPSLSQIAAGLGLRSKTVVHRHVQALAEAGHLQVDPGRHHGISLTDKVATEAFSLPLLGRIAAGRPIEAITDEHSLNLAEFLLGPNRYALRVFGDSMIGAGILDGDTVVVEQRDTASDGDIVVALIDDQEATLKRMKRRKDGMIELIAANPAIPTMVYPADRIRLQGVVVGQLRSYR